jgi:hypothetical protein
VLAFLHWDSIRQVSASDVEARAVQLAEHNLSLLTPQGMERRLREIGAMLRLYGKDSHRQAQESASRLLERIRAFYSLRPIQTRVFQADALDATALQRGLDGIRPEVVFSDLPYGQHSHWQAASSDPVADLLAALRPVLPEGGIAAIASVKGTPIDPPGYRRMEKLQLGKRQVIFLQVI